ncbi:carbohydrate-binding domain-containing protein [Aporhodopirellula aestuarii]|uniref:DUF4347 domain-containing protein n=1 Tax=Aporhodopirellula aestuarii TaxID=2950107 RepID=A0ABT0UCB2_9BACT|nr:DUF4347 domain-containing protein [Aporhodopirellula aestuarii]MCM2374491.1 DUF4347 domain-containing protein [Aporhodopirellula aestuarii]
MLRLRRRYRGKQNRVRWSLSSLEPRLLLAADAGAAPIAAAVADDVPAASESETHHSDAVNLVFIDANIENLSELIDGIDGHYQLILLDANRSGLEQISEVLGKRSNVASLHVIAHGEAGKLAIGNEVVSQQTLIRQQQQIRQWGESLTVDADILVYGCRTGEGDVGRSFVEYLSRLTGADVAASVDATGNTDRNGDWDLERVVGTIESKVVINPRQRDQYQGLFPISIRAAGAENVEQMLLQIDGVTVATYDDVGGDADAGVFVEFTHNIDGITPDQVRIAFTNDSWDPANGIDRNLRVDNITIDGTTYETEDPSVFSTGTWLPADGLQPGFRQSEYLNANGYFQYAESGGNGNEESVIDLRVLGSEGTEQFQLQIDGQVVADFSATNAFQTFSYTTADSVTADQIRIEYTNDTWDPANGIDANLTVDWIEIDGTRYETEGLDVFSTGTWTAADGIQPGFGRGDTLHTNGYFQYAEPTENGNDGSVIDVSAVGAEGTEQFNVQIDGQIVALFSATTGFQTFRYTAADSVTADQVRIAFTNDTYDPANGIDANLTVDWIEIDGARFETEGPAVYSTGTWTAADGIQPGFGRGDTLSTNGYFQYAQTVPGIGDGEIWLLESVLFPGQYMRLEEVGGNVSLSTTADARSMWRVEDTGAGSTLQNVATGQYLDADGTADGGNIDVSGTTIETDDLWLIVDNGAAGLTLRNVDTNGYIDGDSIAEGSNVDQSPTVSADDYWIQTVIVNPDTRALPDANEVTFAAFGDYGIANAQTPLISSLVHGLSADIILGLGDSRYAGETYAGVHGAFYPYYLNGAQPNEDAPTGGTSQINRFFAAPGNHDFDDAGGINEFINYFSLPGDGVPTASSTGSELHYDFLWGPAHFFVIDAESFLNDPSSATAQTAWLQSQLLASTSPWQIVVMHNPPFSSGDDHGSEPALQLDYALWGADLVLTGHDHIYERLERGGITYIVSGLGGKSIRSFDDIETGSIARYKDNFGVSMFTATETQIIGSFIDINGVVQDSFVIESV